ncbi:hypothetical protein Pla22_27000 [Rubripirellula amarantea]|uniref:DUF1559 domain-containing protein n=1 Tax=Rubripirellula amarantea TaxID=2527999 RepID=A0A5C5WWG9_9BACT|nr:DUF1559 domain-containing protein [Rubripirellula amarantea]TWT55046.1 hypothetical protein Pla22_27000 [Rubripirellula amarantea]
MKRYRPGFTLVELLVVIAIIGILMGLLIPAVGAARESARSTQCGVNVRNLALAAVQHNNTKGQLPTYVNKYGYFAGGTDPSDLGNSPPAHVKLGGYGVAILPWLDAQPTYEHWTEDRYPLISTGAGDIGATTAFAGEGYHGLATPNLGVFQCPSNPVSEGRNGRNSYAPNNGLSPIRLSASGNGSPTASDYVVPGATPLEAFVASESELNGVSTAAYLGLDMAPVASGNSPRLPPTGSRPAERIRLEDLKDGQTGTLLYSENIQAMPWHRVGFLGENAGDLATQLAPFAGTQDLDYTATPQTLPYLYAKFTNGLVWHYQDPKFAQLNGLTVPPVSPNGSAVTDVWPQHKINGGGALLEESLLVKTMYENYFDAPSLARPSSAHVEGVNCGFGDGSNRFISESIDYRVYQAMMTPRGKSSDVPWKEFVITNELD